MFQTVVIGCHMNSSFLHLDTIVEDFNFFI